MGKTLLTVLYLPSQTLGIPFPKSAQHAANKIKSLLKLCCDISKNNYSDLSRRVVAVPETRLAHM
jgi:hypothetical protein